MSEQNDTQKEQEFYKQLQEQTGFSITRCENVDFENQKHLEMLKLTPEQKMQISEFLQHVPAIAAAGKMAGAYTVSFPQGLPHTLMVLKKGGYGSSIMENGRIVGSASFYPMLGQAAVYGVFTVLSIATGQFFLAQINKELREINRKLDELLKFLHEDKKAELLSEWNFIKYAYENYASIMAHEVQRVATIGSIQQAKKVAMKDIDFYITWLDNEVNSGAKKDFKGLDKFIDTEIERIRENLEFSLQLYLMSGLMEVFYAQNFEKDYISQLEDSVKSYFQTYNTQISTSYGTLLGYLNKCKVSDKDKDRWEKQTSKLQTSISSLNGNYNSMCENLYAVLHTSVQNTQYYLKANGDVYYKAS